jgi:FkbM family methyltransferase
LFRSIAQFIVNQHSSSAPVSGHWLYFKLLKAVRSLLLPLNLDIVYRIGGSDVVMPFSHALFVHRRQYPNYSENVGRIARYLEHAFGRLEIIDVGANVGDTLAILRQRTACPVLLVEPVPEFLSYLQRNLEGLHNGVVAPYLLGDVGVTGNGTLISASGSAHFRAKQSSGPEITAITLTRLVELYPQFAKSKLLKIDTDGFDNGVIRGGRDFIASAKPVIFFEYDPCYLSLQNESGVDIFPFLSELGYRSLILYDNLGDMLARLDIGQTGILSDLHNYFGGRQSARYMDILALHADDEALADDIHAKEKEFFARLRSYKPAAAGQDGR